MSPAASNTASATGLEVGAVLGVAGDARAGDPVDGRAGDPVAGRAGDPVDGRAGDPVEGREGAPVEGPFGVCAHAATARMTAASGPKPATLLDRVTRHPSRRTPTTPPSRATGW